MVFYFVLSGAGGSAFRGPLESHEGASYYGEMAQSAAGQQRAGWAVEEDVYRAAFDQRADTFAPSLIGLLVPILSGLLAVVLWPVRASGVRHLVFATHCVAALMATLLALMVVVSLLVVAAFTLGIVESMPRGVDPVIVPLAIVGIVTYFVLGIRRVYETPWWGALLSGALIGTLGVYAALIGFRFLLFWATLDPPA